MPAGGSKKKENSNGAKRSAGTASLGNPQPKKTKVSADGHCLCALCGKSSQVTNHTPSLKLSQLEQSSGVFTIS